MSNNSEPNNDFVVDFANHSQDGMDILYSKPAKLMSNTLYLLGALILSVFVWSFVGKSDVIVVTQGTITPGSAIKRIYAPLDGQLIDIYIEEGMPVQKGDLLARIHAPKAIQQSASYLNAQLSLASKEKELSQFMRQKKWRQKKADIIWQRHLNTRNAYQVAYANHALEKNKMSMLEAKFNTDYNKEKDTLLQLEGQVLESRMQYENELAAIKKEEIRLQDGIRIAQLYVNAAAQAAPENIDQDGFLKILSPYSGVVTEVPYSQSGDVIQIKETIAGIVPAKSKMIIEIQIPESKRAFLQQGQLVKLKVAAFAYQRFGVITGTLYFISPLTKIYPGSKKPYYKGRVKLDKMTFTRDGISYPLHYGMTATVEIVVRQRRIIDFVLDPIRGVEN